MIGATTPFRSAVALIALAALSACGLLGPRPSGPPPKRAPTVAPFSAAVAGGPPPEGWHEAAAPRFRKATRYELVDNGGTTVVRAWAEDSSSGFIYDVDIDPRDFPMLRW